MNKRHKSGEAIRLHIRRVALRLQESEQEKRETDGSRTELLRILLPYETGRT
jgi:hypothetical protein